MYHRLKLLLTGLATAAGFLSPSYGLAQTGAGVSPVFFQGTPSLQDVIKICKLPNSDDPTATHEFLFSNPTSGGTRSSGSFTIQLTTGGTRQAPSFGYNDLTQGPSQQLDAPGVDAVVAQSSQGANIYCRINLISDSGLVPPTSSFTRVGFYWALGPCGLPQADADLVCGLYNAETRKADFLQAHLQSLLGQPDPPVNLCGCSPAIARFCDPNLPTGTEGSCNPGAGALQDVEATTAATQDAGDAAAFTAAPQSSAITPQATTGTKCLLFKVGGSWVSSC